MHIIALMDSWISLSHIHIFTDYVDLICMFVTGSDCCEFIWQEIINILLPKWKHIVLPKWKRIVVSKWKRIVVKMEAHSGTKMEAHSTPKMEAHSGTKMEAHSAPKNIILTWNLNGPQLTQSFGAPNLLIKFFETLTASWKDIRGRVWTNIALQFQEFFHP